MNDLSLMIHELMDLDNYLRISTDEMESIVSRCMEALKRDSSEVDQELIEDLQSLAHEVKNALNSAIPPDPFDKTLCELLNQAAKARPKLSKLALVMKANEEDLRIACLKLCKDYPRELLDSFGFLGIAKSNGMFVFDLPRICAFRGFFKVLKLLIDEKIIDPNTQDEDGWTLAHFACMHVDAANRLVDLNSLGISTNIKNSWGATAEDFALAVSLPNSDIQIEVNEEIINTEEFKSRFNAEYSRRTVWNARGLIGLMLGNYKPNPGHPIVQKAYSTFCKEQTSAVGLRTILGLVPMFGQWEGVASRDVKAGEVLAEYVGNPRSLMRVGSVDLDAPIAAGDRYMSLSPEIMLDASEITSEAAFLNHSCPNCFLARVVNEAGLPALVLVAGQNLQKGEQLHFSYGPFYKETVKGMREIGDGANNFFARTRNLTDLQITRIHEQPLYSYTLLSTGDFRRGAKISDPKKIIELAHNEACLTYMIFHQDAAPEACKPLLCQMERRSPAKRPY